MKLLVIITPKENTKKLKAELVAGNFSLTKLISEGGFLEKKNTTFLVGVEDEKVDKALEIIKNNCEQKEKVISAPAYMTHGMESGLNVGGATQVKVGGATVFIVNVERMVKI